MSAYLKWILLLAVFSAHAVEPAKLQRMKVPAPPWPAGDERGMANQIGPATYQRCAWHMQQPGAKAYELSHARSNTMPLSPFAGPYAVKPKATAGIPGTAHAFNSEQFNENAEPAQQGTQMDALGHFGRLAAPWNGQSPLATDGVRYYGGFTQQDVKPTADSPLLKLGIDKAPPIITTAVLLDDGGRDVLALLLRSGLRAVGGDDAGRRQQRREGDPTGQRGHAPAPGGMVSPCSMVKLTPSTARTTVTF